MPCTSSAGPAWSVFWLTVFGFGVSAFWPTIMACAGDRYPQAGASMYSLLAAAGCFGGAVGPMTVGLTADGADAIDGSLVISSNDPVTPTAGLALSGPASGLGGRASARLARRSASSG